MPPISERSRATDATSKKLMPPCVTTGPGVTVSNASALVTVPPAFDTRTVQRLPSSAEAVTQSREKLALRWHRRPVAQPLENGDIDLPRLAFVLRISADTACCGKP
ncbi:MAG: hypothetical protein ABIT82_09785 [Ramlibacter sp.]